MNKMKRIDFENGSVTGNILGATYCITSLTVSISHESPK